MVKTILSGHTSVDTAYVVEDYPYGFTLRCKIRYWLEYKPGKGARLVSQTSNPKVPGDVWNKPKASTYSRFGACLFLDENNHVQWAGLTEYCDGLEAETWRVQYGAGVPETMLDVMNAWVETKIEYDRLKAEGAQWNDPRVTALVYKHGLQKAAELKKAREDARKSDETKGQN